MKDPAILAEIERLNKEFEGADENKTRALEGLIEQAATERIICQRLSERIMTEGEVIINPRNSNQSRPNDKLKVLAQHTATLTNIMNKLMKYLAVDQGDDDEDLEEYE